MGVRVKRPGGGRAGWGGHAVRPWVYRRQKGIGVWAKHPQQGFYSCHNALEGQGHPLRLALSLEEAKGRQKFGEQVLNVG